LKIYISDCQSFRPAYDFINKREISMVSPELPVCQEKPYENLRKSVQSLLSVTG
jgi:hypothetical protein